MLLFVVCFGPKVHDSTVGFRTHSHASPSPFHPAPGVPRTEASQRREILGWPVFLASFLLDKALQTTSQDIPRHPTTSQHRNLPTSRCDGWVSQLIEAAALIRSLPMPQHAQHHRGTAGLGRSRQPGEGRTATGRGTGGQLQLNLQGDAQHTDGHDFHTAAPGRQLRKKTQNGWFVF